MTVLNFSLDPLLIVHKEVGGMNGGRDLKTFMELGKVTSRNDNTKYNRKL